MFWGRQLELLVGQPGKMGVAVDQSFRVVFSIAKTSTKDPNRSKLRIYNCNDDTREVLHAPNSMAILRAGYEQENGLITMFVGDVVNVVSYIDGPDTITEMDLGDGFLPMRDTFVSVGYAAGTSAVSIMRGIAGQMGLVLRPMPEIKDRAYPNGYSYCGQAFRALDKIAEYLGAEWSIQNNEIQVLVRGGVVRQQAVLISPDTGLIGSPEPEDKTFSEKRAQERGLVGGDRVIEIVSSKVLKSGKKSTTKKYHAYGYNVSTYLMPHVQPGSFVKLDTRNTDGYYRVESLEHFGDTWGDEYRTDMVLRSVKNA